MARKKKKGAAASKRRASLKGFAAKAKGFFQSPVHSNGFKQDVLIDLHGGDRGLDAEASVNDAAVVAEAAGKAFFKYGGTTYKVQTTGARSRGITDDRTSPVK